MTCKECRDALRMLPGSAQAGFHPRWRRTWRTVPRAGGR